MKIVKVCAYSTRNYNLLPALLLTTTYQFSGQGPRFSAGVLRSQTMPPADWRRAGFRLGLKFWRGHVGVEVSY